jgi:excinuclease UvrABC ATPase subunit
LPVAAFPRPDGGARGDEIIAIGTPEKVAELEGNETGKYLVKCF